MNDDLQSLLQQHWHYQSFRPQQEEIMRSVLEGRDTLALCLPEAVNPCAFRCLPLHGRDYAWLSVR